MQHFYVLLKTSPPCPQIQHQWSLQQCIHMNYYAEMYENLPDGVGTTDSRSSGPMSADVFLCSSDPPFEGRPSEESLY